MGRTSLRRAKLSCGDLPVEVERDSVGTGAGPTRNRAIQRVETDWVGYLDDDDEYTSDFPEVFAKEIKNHPEADVIIFRMQYPDGSVLPKMPQIIWGNCGISYVVKTEWAKKVPFVKGNNDFQQNEDFQNLRDLQEAGAIVVFSTHIVYKVKPSSEAQESANKYHS